MIKEIMEEIDFEINGRDYTIKFNGEIEDFGKFLIVNVLIYHRLLDKFIDIDEYYDRMKRFVNKKTASRFVDDIEYEIYQLTDDHMHKSELLWDE